MDLKYVTTVAISDVIDSVAGQCQQAFQTYKFKCGDQAPVQAATVVAADHHLGQVAHTMYCSLVLTKVKHIVFVQAAHIAAGANKLLQEYAARQLGLIQHPV